MSQKHTSRWTLFYANVRGIASKKLSIINILGEMNPEIALFTETMLKGTSGINLDNYTFCGKGREKKACGGVGILVYNRIKHVVTPHESLRDIELIWVSVRRKNQRPIYIGVYYGKQESRNNRNEMLLEMDQLSDEIEEKKKEGEVILFMDGNGKIGILGEEISRNGRLLLDVFEEKELEVMNRSDKCKGAVTRVNRKNKDEASAIDFLVVTEDIEPQIEEMTIDEDGEYLLQGTAPSDHNTFLLKMSIQCIDNQVRKNAVRWRLGAPVEKWEAYEEDLTERSLECARIMERKRDIDADYEKWKNEIKTAAFNTIGKTTMKSGGKRNESAIVKSIRSGKRQAKKAFEKERNGVMKNILKDQYLQKQHELKKQIEYEYDATTSSKFSTMMNQGINGFWKQIKMRKRDSMSDWISVKDENGNRILDPERQKEVIASYYYISILLTQN